jgi:hypothetical protein
MIPIFAPELVSSFFLRRVKFKLVTATTSLNSSLDLDTFQEHGLQQEEVLMRLIWKVCGSARGKAVIVFDRSRERLYLSPPFRLRALWMKEGIMYLGTDRKA